MMTDTQATVLMWAAIGIATVATLPTGHRIAVSVTAIGVILGTAARIILG